MKLYSYFINEFEDSYGKKKYHVCRKTLGIFDSFLSYGFSKFHWRSNSFDTPLEYDSIEKAEQILQKFIWQCAFEIKSERKARFKRKRSIPIPPWGNK